MRLFLLLILISHSTWVSQTRAEHVTERATTSWLLFDEGMLAGNAAAIQQKGRLLNDADRIELLVQWVLPSASHPTFRVIGDFARSSADSVTTLSAGAATGRGLNFRSQLVSPVFDLVDAAKRLDQLPQLRARVVDIPDSANQHAAKLALLALIELESGTFAPAEERLEELEKSIVPMMTRTQSQNWAALLVIERYLQQELSSGRPMPQAVQDLLTRLYRQSQSRRKPMSEDRWSSYLNALWNHHRTFQRQVAESAMATPGKDIQWVAAKSQKAVSRGDGYPPSVWHWNGNEGHLLSGSGREYLLYAAPLLGDYEFEADVSPNGRTQVLCAGDVFGITSDSTIYNIGSLKTGLNPVQVEPPFAKISEWGHCRITMRGGVRTVYLNGRRVREDEIPEGHFPWIGLRGWYHSDAPLRDVRITGRPVIPQEVSLSNHPDLPGWESYFDESIGLAKTTWRFLHVDGEAAEIRSYRHPSYAGTFRESLLQYQRPIPTTGAVRYEFFYEPDGVIVHPAVGRMALMLLPDGVNLHWITDGPFDRGQLSPSATILEPEAQRGPASLPLKAGQWNSATVSLTEKRIRLELNGELVFERKIEPENLRTFGLFRFGDQHDVRVRNVTMSGDWPQTLPELMQQSLAAKGPLHLDSSADPSRPVYFHEFSLGTLPPTEFAAPKGRDFSVRSGPFGLGYGVRSTGNWSQSAIPSLLQMEGDFDVEARLHDLRMTGSGIGGPSVVLKTDDGFEVELNRRKYKGQKHRVSTAWREPAGEGEFKISYENLDTEATSGTFRFSRSDNVITTLFAENDSTNFRIVSQRELENSGSTRATVQLQIVASEGGTTFSTWGSLKLSAERLYQLPNPATAASPVLMTMNVDGSDLKQITHPIPGVPSQGSPDWSPDGKWIAFDGWQGTAEKTHMYLVSSSGSEVKDLGIGTMPTFSPNGQKLAFTWGGNGMTIMDVDGTNREVISNEGWGAQYSPDGKTLAYQSYGRTADGQLTINITVIDIESREKRLLLGDKLSQRYSQIYWNMEWSPDAKHICFKGNNRTGATELAIVRTDGPPEALQVLSTLNVDTDFSWHPTEDRLLFATHSKEHAGRRLFECDIETQQITLLKSQPMSNKNFSGVWSRDGRKIVFVSEPKPQAVPWLPAPKTKP